MIRPKAILLATFFLVVQQQPAHADWGSVKCTILKTLGADVPEYCIEWDKGMDAERQVAAVSHLNKGLKLLVNDQFELAVMEFSKESFA